jgi:NCAIR mutase (PurE)-related protein
LTKKGKPMHDVENILKLFKSGKISLEEAKKSLSMFSLEFIEEGVKLDLNRYIRKGIPEVINVEKKSPQVVEDIVIHYMRENSALLLSRVFKKHLDILKESIADQFDLSVAPSYEPFTVTVTKKDFEFPKSPHNIGLLTAGTSDIPIAEEVKGIARLMGVNVIQFNDVGIAGVHRLFSPLKKMVEKNVRVIVVIAGMEGALPAIISSLVSVPVIGVPASTGYGYGGKGIEYIHKRLIIEQFVDTTIFRRLPTSAKSFKKKR